jgi:histidinol dehydrogenase
MQVLRTCDSAFQEDLLNILCRGETESSEVEGVVREIIKDVRRRGDQALIDQTEKFDGIQLLRDQLLVNESEFLQAQDSMDSDVMDLVMRTGQRIRDFHEEQKESSWFKTETNGTVLGQKISPLERIGVYVPGGKAFYPSTVLMNVIPALVAGVKEIVICSPPDISGKLHPCLLAGAAYLEVREIYRVGGAQAIAAMAFGTETIPAVDKIVGPGNIYVATAKKLLFGTVGIDMIAGPSEIVVLADKTAQAAHVAADLLSQAEHDEQASAILVTCSQELAEKVEQEIQKQSASLARSDIIKHSLEKYGRIYLTRNLAESLDLVNRIAPEHLELMLENPWEVLGGIINAGAIFLGPLTPEALGDYGAGPNHVLPTGGTARFSSPLGVYDFYKRSSILSFSQQGISDLGPDVATFSRLEGFDGHAESVQIRLDDKQESIDK